MRTSIICFMTILLLASFVWAQSPDAGVADAGTQTDVLGTVGSQIDDQLDSTDKDVGEQISTMIQLFREGRWAPAIGLVLMLIIRILRRFVQKIIPKNAIPWFTLGLGMLFVVSTELIAGITWWKTLIDGFLTSSAGMAFWSLAFKHILKFEKENA